MVLIMDKDDYKLHYRTKLPMTTNPSVYDEDIPNNATNVVHGQNHRLPTICRRQTCNPIMYTRGRRRYLGTRIA